MGLLRTKKFKYVDFGENGCVSHEITEQEILEKHWNSFHYMIWNKETPSTLRIRKLPMSLQCDECIAEFLIVHWAWEIKDDK